VVYSFSPMPRNIPTGNSAPTSCQVSSHELTCFVLDCYCSIS
jgi:hypothetical protein